MKERVLLYPIDPFFVPVADYLFDKNIDFVMASNNPSYIGLQCKNIVNRNYSFKGTIRDIKSVDFKKIGTVI